MKFWFLGLSRKLYNIYGQTREYNNVITKLRKGKRSHVSKAAQLLGEQI